MSEQNIYKSAFFIVPSRILNLPDLKLSYLRVYETIFQFWNHGKPCYLSNNIIKERTGISSESTIRDAFVFFEKHGELIRRTVKGKRYLVQPERLIEEVPVDKSENSCTKNNTPAANSAPPRRQLGAPPAANSAHNINKINKKNISKSKVGENIDLPEWLDKQDWDDFKQHRKDMKKPMNEDAEKRAILKLSRLKQQGHSIREIINESLINAWAGLFEPKKRGSGTTRAENRSTVPDWGPGHPTYDRINQSSR